MSNLKRKAEDTHSKKRFKTNLTHLRDNPTLSAIQSRTESSYKRTAPSQNANSLLGSIMDDRWRMSPVVSYSMKTLFKKKISNTPAQSSQLKIQSKASSLADAFGKLSKINDNKVHLASKPNESVQISKLDFTISEEPISYQLLSKLLNLIGIRCLQISASKKGLITPIKPSFPTNTLIRPKKYRSRVDEKFLKQIKKGS